jgi:hypothetical protein
LSRWYYAVAISNASSSTSSAGRKRNVGTWIIDTCYTFGLDGGVTMKKGAEEPVVQVGVALVSIRPDQDTQIALVAKENFYYLTKHKI